MFFIGPEMMITAQKEADADVVTSIYKYLFCFAEVVDCGDPGIPTNGRRFGTIFTAGSTVRFACDSGYKLNGASTVTCRNTGQWSATRPTCTGQSNCLKCVLSKIHFQ